MRRRLVSVVALVAACRSQPTAKPVAANSPSPRPPAEVPSTLHADADRDIQPQTQAPGADPEPDATTRVPAEVVMEHAIYTPDPSYTRVVATAAAAKRDPVTTNVGFCVSTSGIAEEVKVLRRSGDPELDAICLDAVRSWRFRPILVDGAPARTCSKTKFRFEFD